jgi:hypothetical protein
VNFCKAVTGFFVGAPSPGPILTYNGATWSVDPSALPTDWFGDVACLSTTFCKAVGFNASNGVTGRIQSWNGMTWSLDANIATAPPLVGVACVSPIFCKAVGATDASGATAAILSWDGTGWSADLVSNAGQLSKVACTSTSFCKAVGDAIVSLAPPDMMPPDTSITAQPPALSNSTTASFSFIGTDNVTPPASLTFECKLDSGAFAPCTSPKVYTGLTNGSHTVQVRATDAASLVDPTPASYTWTVDNTPLTVTCSASPSSLAPPNHQLVLVTVTVTASDPGTPTPPSVTLVSVTSSEPDNGLGDGDTAGDIQGWTMGTDDRDGQLRAERAGGGPGRVYTLTYRATDPAGNTATASCTVTVPRS